MAAFKPPVDLRIHASQPATMSSHVLAYLRHHCTADVNIEDVARRSGYSLRTFARTFREVTGTTPHNYLVQLRISHAKRAIRTTSNSITEIAFASGFHDSNYFSVCFSKMTGLSPSEYRRQIQDQHELHHQRKPS